MDITVLPRDLQIDDASSLQLYDCYVVDYRFAERQDGKIVRKPMKK
ncbi:MAG: hypothetical protein AAFQ68_04435 [Bacteroidota bacterium]